LDRRKPQDRKRRFRVDSRQELPAYGRDEYQSGASIEALLDETGI
jgi:hypothetical protein